MKKDNYIFSEPILMAEMCSQDFYSAEEFQWQLVFFHCLLFFLPEFFMEEFPVIDLFPDAIMQDAQSKQKLMDSGYGYML